jgi:hypothetical protein
MCRSCGIFRLTKTLRVKPPAVVREVDATASFDSTPDVEQPQVVAALLH